MTLAGTVLALLADPPKPDTHVVQSVIWLWIGLVAMGVILVASAWALVSSSRKRAEKEERRRHSPRPILNAWEEAGRRLEAEPKPQVDDEQSEEDTR